jgi:hypothetical protein
MASCLGLREWGSAGHLWPTVPMCCVWCKATRVLHAIVGTRRIACSCSTVAAPHRVCRALTIACAVACHLPLQDPGVASVQRIYKYYKK